MFRVLCISVITLFLASCFGSDKTPELAKKPEASSARPTAAEQENNRSCRRELDQISTYYKNPDPERVGKMLFLTDACQIKISEGDQWGLVGFLAALFEKHPERVEIWTAIPATNDLKRITTLALVLSGKRERAQKYVKLAGVAGKNWDYFNRLETGIMNLSVSSGSGQDVYWGASFATGDPKYTRKFLGEIAQFLEKSDIVTEDVSVLADSSRRDQNVKLLKIKELYSRDNIYPMLSAVAAVWSAHSNANQHAFIKAELNRVLAESGTENLAYAIDRANRRQRHENPVIANTKSVNFIYSVAPKDQKGTIELLRSVSSSATKRQPGDSSARAVAETYKKFSYDYLYGSVASVGLLTFEGKGPGGTVEIVIKPPSGKSQTLNTLSIPASKRLKGKIFARAEPIPLVFMRMPGEHSIQLIYTPKRGAPKKLPKRTFFVGQDYRELPGTKS